MDTPIACTLTQDELGTQQTRWRALPFASREETEDGIRLSFHDDDGVREELDALVAIERRCCAWATWQLDGTVLDVRSTGDGVTALHGMFRL